MRSPSARTCRSAPASACWPTTATSTATLCRWWRGPSSAADLLGNDSDVDGDSLSIASVTSGTGGTAVLNADGTVTFTPDADFNGVATFSYTVTDGSLVSNTATVTVNEGHRGVLGRRQAVVVGQRGVVHRRDRQSQGRGVGQAAVGDGVVHRVGAVEVRRRRVGVAAVGGDHDAAAAR
ncbi:cadherin-like domain-containing protein [Pseudomonas stutzeri]|nr:cadherin-like domain-containing protein [Stutzerimonas stutzeri]